MGIELCARLIEPVLIPSEQKHFARQKKNGGDDGSAALSLSLIALASGKPQTGGRSAGIPLSFARV
jgi:hypothetical protein